MNVDQAAKARDALQAEILRRIEEFESTTGLTVAEVALTLPGWTMTLLGESKVTPKRHLTLLVTL